jgi:hypothetical protein
MDLIKFGGMVLVAGTLVMFYLAISAILGG